MNYTTGEKIQLLDEVKWSDKRGFVVGFDKVDRNEFVEVRAQEGVWSSKLWVSPNMLTKMRTLKVDFSKPLV